MSSTHRLNKPRKLIQKQLSKNDFDSTDETTENSRENNKMKSHARYSSFIQITGFSCK